MRREEAVWREGVGVRARARKQGCRLRAVSGFLWVQMRREIWKPLVFRWLAEAEG